MEVDAAKIAATNSLNTLIADNAFDSWSKKFESSKGIADLASSESGTYADLKAIWNRDASVQAADLGLNFSNLNDTSKWTTDNWETYYTA
jgi:hypothetical protein